MIRLSGIVIALAGCASAGGSGPELLEMEVAPYTVPCQGLVLQQCLRVAIDGGEMQNFSSGIEGFFFVPHDTAILEVEREVIEEPLADDSSFRYTFVSELERRRASPGDTYSWGFGRLDQVVSLEGQAGSIDNHGRFSCADASVCEELQRVMDAGVESAAMLSFAYADRVADPYVLTAVDPLN